MTSNRASAFLAAVLAGVALSVRAADPAAALPPAELLELNARHAARLEQALTPLRQAYLTQLRYAQRGIQQRGDTTGALLAQKEIETVTAGGTPVPADKEPRELTVQRQNYLARCTAKPPGMS